MKTTSVADYILSCLLLILPIMAWNVILSSKLPASYSSEIFDRNIPVFIVNGENIFRLFIFVLPVLMPLRIETQSQKLGLWLYVAGTVMYFISWLPQIYSPQSAWSLSAFGFLAPAYTPLIWLVGIGLIGNTLYFASPYRSWMYVVASIIFLGFHLSHAATAYFRNFLQS